MSCEYMRKKRKAEGSGSPSKKEKDEADVEKVASNAEQLIELLRFTAENHFDFERYQEAWEVLKQVRQLEENIYGTTSKQLLDTEYAIFSIMSSFEEGRKCEAEAKKQWNLVRRRCQLVHGSSDAIKHYEPGPTCAKNIVADMIKYMENMEEGTGAKLIKLYKAAYDERLKEFGPDALMTFLAQRAYYKESVKQLGDKCKITKKDRSRLVKNLQKCLGEDHKLCNGLEVALDLTEMKGTLNDMKKMWNFMPGNDPYQRDQDDPALYWGPNWPLVQEAISMTKTAVQRNRENFDKFKEARAKEKKEEAEEDIEEEIESLKTEVVRLKSEVGPADSETLFMEFELAVYLLRAFKYDDGFQMLVKVHAEQVKRLGHGHPETTDTLQAICDTDLCEEFVSFRVLKDIKKYFDSMLPTLKKKAKKERALIARAEWIHGYLICVVMGNEHDGTRMMRNARDDYGAVGVDDDNSGILMQYMGFVIGLRMQLCDQNNIAKTMFDQTFPILEAMLDENDRLLLRLRIGIALNAHRRDKNKQAINTLMDVYKRASDHLKPDDPVVGVAISTIHFVISRVQNMQGPRETDMTFFKNAHKRLKERLGEEHPETVKALAVVAAAYGHPFLQLVPKCAGEISRDAARLGVKVFGTDHDVTIKAMVALGAVLAKDVTKQGYAEAKRVLREAVQLQKKLKGVGHCWYQALCGQVKTYFLIMNDLDSAVDFGEEACQGNIDGSDPGSKFMKQVVDMMKFVRDSEKGNVGVGGQEQFADLMNNMMNMKM